MNSIYKITCNVNQKVYIGFTTQNVNARFNQHLKESKNKNDIRKFYCAIRKHGPACFCVETLYQSKEFKHTLEVMEDFFIQQYNSIKSGYNSKVGGTTSVTKGRTKSVDMYNDTGKLVHKFSKLKDCAEYLDALPCRISSACTNANNNKASQVNGYWVCYTGDSPVYKIYNNTPGCEAARDANTGKKRPEHAVKMKYIMHKKDQQNKYTFAHISGVTFRGSRRDLINAYPEHSINNSQLGTVISGKQKSCKGWSLCTN